MIARKILLAFLLLAGLTARAQDDVSEQTDSSNVAVDSASQAVDSLYDDYQEDDQPDAVALPDTLAIDRRSFDDEQVRALKADKQMHYKELPTVAESLWDRLLAWLGELIGSLLRGGFDTSIGRLLLFLLGMAVVIVLVMVVLRVNAFRIFYSGEGATTFSHNVFDENIHEMDFDKLIQEAAARNDYRTAVRLVFLHALKMLSDKQLIHWQRGKTNHDYMAELSRPDLKPGFDDLNYYFEYAWYGNFTIDSALFSRVQQTFTQWKGMLR